MISSPQKFDPSTTYKSVRTPNIDVIKRQIEQFKLQSRYESRRQYKQQINHRNVQDVQRRVEIVLKQNSNLLAENADLSELLAQRAAEIQLLQQRLKIQTTQSAFVVSNSLIEQLELRQSKHLFQIKRLLQQIEILNQEYGSLQKMKRVQIQCIKQQYSRQVSNQVANLKRSQRSNFQLYEIEIRRLKDEIQTHKYKNDQTILNHKSQTLKFKGEIQKLQIEIRNIKQLKESQLQNLKRSSQEKLINAKRQVQNMQQIYQSKVDNNLRKVKRQLADKNQQNQKIANRLNNLKQQYQTELLQLNQEKNKLKLQNQLSEQKFKEEVNKLKINLEGFNKKQIQAIADINKQLTQSLNSQLSKLYQINSLKILEIKRLRENQNIQRVNYQNMMNVYQKQNEELRNKLGETQLNHKAEIQTLKIKIAQLHYSQVNHLQKYLENEVSILSEQIILQQRIIEQNRSKLHLEIQDKDQLRKYYEIELSKQKAKVIDLKVKLAATSVQMKQQISSLASKMQLTSQTLLRQVDLKQKGQSFMQQQKRKLQILINSKDKEILLLNQQLNGIKRQHIIQVTNLEEYIRQLKNINEQQNINHQKDKQFYENEIKKKQYIYKNQIEQLKEQLLNIKKIEYSKVKDQIQQLQRQNIRLNKQLENQGRQHQFKLQQLNLHKGFVQNMQLESSAALEEEKGKYQVLINQNQITLKAFFEQKVNMKNKQIHNIKQQLGQKETDLRDIIGKYKQLERKLRIALDSIDRLTDLQNRVLNLGMDNNLIKNLAELFKGNNRHKD